MSSKTSNSFKITVALDVDTTCISHTKRHISHIFGFVTLSIRQELDNRKIGVAIFYEEVVVKNAWNLLL